MFSYESILSSNETNFKFIIEESYENYADRNDSFYLPTCHLVLVKNPIFKADVCVTFEPNASSASQYAAIAFKLKPLVIVSAAEEDSFRFISINGKIRTKTRMPGFVILCKLSDVYKFDQRDNIEVYDLEIINLNVSLTVLKFLIWI